MTMHLYQRRRLLRRMDLLLCKLLGIDPGPDPFHRHASDGFSARPAQRSSRRRSKPDAAGAEWDEGDDGPGPATGTEASPSRSRGGRPPARTRGGVGCG